MKTNALPFYDNSDNPTGCCPRFNTQGWDNQELHFEDMLFVKAETRSLFHIPINMGSVFAKTFKAIEDAGAHDKEHFIVLSYDPSAWSAEHYFAITQPVPGLETIRLSGDYVTRVFEGPYKDAPKWEAQMQADLADQGLQTGKIYLFYTTCPNCAKVYGKNYVVGVAELANHEH